MTTYNVNDIVEVTFTHGLINHTIKAICISTEEKLFLTVANNKVFLVEFTSRMNNQIQFIYLGDSVDNPNINNQLDLNNLRKVLFKEINKVSSLDIVPNLFKHLENLELGEVDIYASHSQQLFTGEINRIDYLSGKAYVTINMLNINRGEYDVDRIECMFNYTNISRVSNNILILLDKKDVPNIQLKIYFKNKINKIIESMEHLRNDFEDNNLLNNNYNNPINSDCIKKFNELISGKVDN